MADKTMENLLIFGGLGLVAWWVYDTYFATPATAAAPATTSTAASSVATSAPVSTPATTVQSCPAGYTLTGGACIPNPPAPVAPITYAIAPLNYSDSLRAAVASGEYLEAIGQQNNLATVNRSTDPGAATKVNAALSGLGALVRMHHGYR
jgi:hypothetical protein